MEIFVRFLIYFIIGLAGLFAAIAILFTTFSYLILFIIGKEFIKAAAVIVLIFVEIFAINYLLYDYHSE